MRDEVFFWISGLAFGAAAAAHLLRVMYGWNMALGPYTVPMWASWVGFIVASVLCLGACHKAAREGRSATWMQEAEASPSTDSW